jgi:hypothetical protein
MFTCTSLSRTSFTFAPASNSIEAVRMAHLMKHNPEQLIFFANSIKKKMHPNIFWMHFLIWESYNDEFYLDDFE